MHRLTRTGPSKSFGRIHFKFFSQSTYREEKSNVEISGIIGAGSIVLAASERANERTNAERTDERQHQELPVNGYDRQQQLGVVYIEVARARVINLI